MAKPPDELFHDLDDRAVLAGMIVMLEMLWCERRDAWPLAFCAGKMVAIHQLYGDDLASRAAAHLAPSRWSARPRERGT